jgi:hypothetical protein
VAVWLPSIIDQVWWEWQREIGTVVNVHEHGSWDSRECSLNLVQRLLVRYIHDIRFTVFFPRVPITINNIDRYSLTPSIPTSAWIGRWIKEP